MTDSQENYLSMCKAVQKTMDDYNGVWSSFTPVVNTNTEFNTLVSQMESARNIQEIDITGYTVTKENKRKELIHLAAKISKDITAYAMIINDPGLKEEVDYPKSEFDKSRDDVIVAKAQAIFDRTSAHIGSMAGYQVTAQMLTDLQTLISEYTILSQLPSTKSDYKEAATGIIKQAITNIRLKLAVMDKLIGAMQDNFPEFYTVYFNSREIYDLGGKKAKDEEPVPDPA